MTNFRYTFFYKNHQNQFCVKCSRFCGYQNYLDVLKHFIKNEHQCFYFHSSGKNGKQYHIQLSSKGHQNGKILSKLAKNTICFIHF